MRQFLLARIVVNFVLAVAMMIQPAYSQCAESPIRVQRGLRMISYFDAPPPGFARRWYRRFCQPSYCKMNLCHGTCADTMHSIYDTANTTPCGLRTFNNLLSEALMACCLSENTQQLPLIHEMCTNKELKFN